MYLTRVIAGTAGLDTQESNKSMKKILILLIGLVLLAAAGGAGYLGYLQFQHDSELEPLKAFSQQSAQRVSQQAGGWRNAVIELAAKPELTELLTKGDANALQIWLETEQQRQQDLLRLRALPPGHLETDTEHSPHMGFAGLELLRQAESEGSRPKPEVHMMGNDQRHVGMAARIESDGKLVGVLLASFDVGGLKKVFMTSATTDKGWLSLQQKQLRIAGAGDGNARTQPEVGAIPVAGTGWHVSYRQAPLVLPLTMVDVAVYAGVAIALIVLLAGLVAAAKSSVGRKSAKSGLEKLKRKRELGVEESESNLTFAEQLAAEEAAGDTFDKPKYQVKEGQEHSNPTFMGEGGIELEEDIGLSSTIFRAYDIRGIVGETLTEEVVEKIGQAVATEALAAEQNTVVIARDGRHSSPSFSEALAKGLQSAGCNVIDIGKVPTPVLYFATHVLETQSGVMITGSHNPSNYNGLKIVIAGNTLSGDAIRGLYERIKADDLASGEGEYEERLMLPEYIGAISSDVRMGRMMKVVVDCGNGVAGEAAPMLLSTIGCEVVPLYCEIDGDFPNHHPDPSKPENLQDLIAKVKEEEAELGLAFDGDGDRLGVVDCDGNILWPDRQMMLYAADVLSRAAGADIIYDVKCSRHLAKQIVKNGGRPVMAQTGHSLIKAKMKETGAELAGEMSGHIFFKERWYGFDDGLYTAARLLEIVSAEFRTTAEIFAELPDAISTPELNVDMQEEGANFEFIQALQDSASFEDANVITIDGLRVEYQNGWGLVRASNTTPTLVIRFEADSDAALERIQDEFRVAMLKVKPDMALPF